MKIYLPSDRIPVLVGSLKFWISPLTFSQKTEMLAAIKMNAGAEVKDNAAIGTLALKLSVKGFECMSGEPITDARGEPISLGFEGDRLNDDSVELLLQLEEFGGILEACGKMWSQVKDPQVDGVKVDFDNVVKSEKKAVASES